MIYKIESVRAATGRRDPNLHYHSVDSFADDRQFTRHQRTSNRLEPNELRDEDRHPSQHNSSLARLVLPPNGNPAHDGINSTVGQGISQAAFATDNDGETVAILAAMQTKGEQEAVEDSCRRDCQSDLNRTRSSSDLLSDDQGDHTPYANLRLASGAHARLANTGTAGQDEHKVQQVAEDTTSLTSQRTDLVNDSYQGSSFGAGGGLRRFPPIDIGQNEQHAPPIGDSLSICSPPTGSDGLTPWNTHHVPDTSCADSASRTYSGLRNELSKPSTVEDLGHSQNSEDSRISGGSRNQLRVSTPSPASRVRATPSMSINAILNPIRGTIVGMEYFSQIAARHAASVSSIAESRNCHPATSEIRPSTPEESHRPLSNQAHIPLPPHRPIASLSSKPHQNAVDQPYKIPSPILPATSPRQYPESTFVARDIQPPQRPNPIDGLQQTLVALQKQIEEQMGNNTYGNVTAEGGSLVQGNITINFTNIIKYSCDGQCSKHKRDRDSPVEQSPDRHTSRRDGRPDGDTRSAKRGRGSTKHVDWPD